MDLFKLQEVKQIRNPFKFDFYVPWTKRYILLPSDGKWYQVITPLHKHIAKHLYSKIRWQYHDEQKAELIKQGRKDEARVYQVDAKILDKIWYLITGETRPGRTKESLAAEQADLSALKQTLSGMDTAGDVQPKVFENVVQLKEANELAKSLSVKEGFTSKTTMGAAVLAQSETPISATDIINSQSTPAPTPQTQPSSPVQTPVESPKEPATFSDLSNLDAHAG